MERRIRVARLRRRADVGRLFADAGVGKSRWVLARALPCPEAVEGPRVAVIAPKRLGNAVRRNRAKRRLREAVRRVADELPPADLVLIARGGRNEPGFADLVASVREAVGRAWREATR